MEYPENIKARKNLEELIYNESLIPGVSNSVIDDLFLFRAIQTDKYMGLKKKKEFRTIKEAKRITEIIVKAFIEKFGIEIIGLDSMTLEEKTALFKKIEIDF